jgi:2-dehydropantoate 2-reductase
VAEDRIAVLGAGAIGGYLGARLAAANPGRPVTLIARPAVVAAIRRNGLIIRGEGHEPDLTVAVDAVSSVQGLTPFDLVLLTVRTFSVQDALPDLQTLMGDTGLAIAFQNGVGSEEGLAAALGRRRLLAGSLTVSCGMDAPGVVTRYSRAGGVALATMDGAPVPDRVVTPFAATGLPTVAVPDYRALRWSKLLLNMLGAATTAILDMDVAAVMANRQLFRAEQLAFREAGRVMDALGIQTVDLPGYRVNSARRFMRTPGPLAQRLVGTRVAKARSGRSPGARSDMRRGRSELDTFNGAIAAAGTRAGVPTPVNAGLAELAAALAADEEKRAQYRGRPDALQAYLHDRGIML